MRWMQRAASRGQHELSHGDSIRKLYLCCSRTDATYRNVIEEGGRFEPAWGRYHLYAAWQRVDMFVDGATLSLVPPDVGEVALACPWADGTLAALYLKGLEHVISFSVVHPTWQRSRPENPSDMHCGWAFRNPGDPPLANSLGFGKFECDDALVADIVNNCKFVRDLYEKSNDKTGKYSTPVLWDKKEGTIVNNESMDILKMFNTKFNKFAKNPEFDLFPAHLAKVAEEANAWIYPNINNGVYRCGFAKTQEAYDMAVKDLAGALDKAESLLAKQRYVCGDTFTFMDLRLFMTLVRFDPVYVVYFKTNVGTIEMNYPNLYNYIKDIYQFRNMAKAINIRHIKMHYFTSHPDLNKFAIIPKGRDMDLAGPHNRGKAGKAVEVSCWAKVMELISPSQK